MRATRREISISQTFAFYSVSARYWLSRSRTSRCCSRRGRVLQSINPEVHADVAGRQAAGFTSEAFWRERSGRSQNPEGMRPCARQGQRPLVRLRCLHGSLLQLYFQTGARKSAFFDSVYIEGKMQTLRAALLVGRGVAGEDPAGRGAWNPAGGAEGKAFPKWGPG
jgi:hypothetical protein